MVADFLVEEVHEAAVGGFLGSHAIKGGRRSWKVLAEAIGAVRGGWKTDRSGRQTDPAFIDSPALC